MGWLPTGLVSDLKPHIDSGHGSAISWIDSLWVEVESLVVVEMWTGSTSSFADGATRVGEEGENKRGDYGTDGAEVRTGMSRGCGRAGSV